MSNAERIKEYKDLLDAGAITREEFEKKKAELLAAAEPSENAQSAAYGQNAQSPSFSTTTTAVIAYLTLIGFIIAMIAGDRVGAKFHLNQALVIELFAFLYFIPLVGWIWGIFILVVWIMGLVAAANGQEKEVPLLGKIKLLK